MKPTIGRIVHYVSHGTPLREDGSQAYKSECRAAVVTEVPWPDDPEVDDSAHLVVLNPTGLFFKEGVPHLQPNPEDEELFGGTWHWPKRD